MPAAKIFTLKTKRQDPITLLGLLTEEKDYKLSWYLNKTIGTHLIKAADFIWMNKQMQTMQKYPCFIDTSENRQSVKLIRNLSNEQIQIHPFQQFDFLLLIPSDSAYTQNDFTEALRDSGMIRGIYELDPSAILNWLD